MASAPRDFYSTHALYYVAQANRCMLMRRVYSHSYCGLSCSPDHRVRSPSRAAPSSRRRRRPAHPPGPPRPAEAAAAATKSTFGSPPGSRSCSRTAAARRRSRQRSRSASRERRWRIGRHQTYRARPRVGLDARVQLGVCTRDVHMGSAGRGAILRSASRQSSEPAAPAACQRCGAVRVAAACMGTSRAGASLQREPAVLA